MRKAPQLGEDAMLTEQEAREFSASGVDSVDGVSSRGLAGFEFQQYNRQYIQMDGATPVNTAAHYGVRITPATVADGLRYWRLIGVRHLTPEENRGNHVVFVDILDEAGNRIRNPALRLQWGWEGQQATETAPPKQFDKGVDEPATNLDLYKGQNAWVRVTGDGLPSDTVENLHTNHDDEKMANGDLGNSRFHHSYYVVFQQAVKAANKLTIVDGDTSGGASGDQSVKPPTNTDNATYLPDSDWVKDGTRLAPGQPFAQSWRLRNSGSSAWGFGYKLCCTAQEPMNAPSFVEAPACPPGETVYVTVPLRSPAAPGKYTGIWQLCNPAGTPFGDRLTTVIEVVANPTTGGVGLPPLDAQAQALAAPADQVLPGEQSADPSERATATTWNRYGGLVIEQATRLGIDPAAAVAVLLVESKGDAFGPDGRLIIRFENHIFYQFWGKQHEEQFRQHFSFDANTTWQGHQWRPDSNGPWLPMHQLDGQANEWRAFELARSFDETAALKSLSMGLPQIMGFNHATLGYPTVQAMFQDFQKDVRNHLASFFSFMEKNGLVEAVRQGDYRAFAKVYNGPGQMDEYARRMEQYAQTFRTLRAGATIRGLEAQARLPMPPSPVAGKTLAEADPELYAAWRNHIRQSFANNQTMFQQILTGFMNPYWTTVWMYRILFGVGILAFVVAAVLGALGYGAPTTAIFGGLSVVTFLAYFLNRPLQALEENLQFITWLGVIYNSYWTRLAYIQKLDTVQQEVTQATDDAITKIKELMDKHVERNNSRSGLR